MKLFIFFGAGITSLVYGLMANPIPLFGDFEARPTQSGRSGSDENPSS